MDNTKSKPCVSHRTVIHCRDVVQKRQYTLGVIFIVVCCVVTGIAVTAIVISLNSAKQLENPIRDTASSRTDEYGTTEKVDMQPQEHIEVVGDGRRHMSVEKGSKLRHWKHSTRTGKIRLKHHSLIIINVPGLYRIYGQYAVLQQNRTSTAVGPINVLLMQNKNELCMSVVHQCRRVCTRAFSKTARLKMGDKVWLKSGTGGVFLVDEKHSYFGANLLQGYEGYVTKPL